MDDDAFDRALIAAAFALIAERGWRHTSVAEAARAAGLPLDRARRRFPGRHAILLRFGQLADAAALGGEGAATEGARDRLFDVLMRRIDWLQLHRAGTVALLRGLPADPCTAMLLAGATLRSMRWMLEGAGIDATGTVGTLRAKGLMGVWLATVRTWISDQGEDLSATMAALDRALDQAARIAAWLPGVVPPAAPEPPPPPGETAPAIM